MRTAHPAALGLAAALVSVVLPTATPAAATSPCAAPSPVGGNGAEFDLNGAPREKPTGTAASAFTAATACADTYTFIVRSLLRDRHNELVPLGWTTTSTADSPSTVLSSDGLEARITFLGGLDVQKTFAFSGSTSGYYNRKEEDTEHCLSFQLLIQRAGDRDVYLPTDDDPEDRNGDGIPDNDVVVKDCAGHDSGATTSYK